MAPTGDGAKLVDSWSGVCTGNRYVKDEHGNVYLLQADEQRNGVELTGTKFDTRIKVKR